MRCRLPGVAVLLVPALAAAPVLANPVAVPSPVRRALRAASVVVLPARCGGVLAASPQLVATALHCIDRGAALRVRASDGAVFEARLEATDADADQAVLSLVRPLAAEPLEIARRAPIDGTVVFFEGNPDQPRLQDARIDRRGRCESLPRLPDALFTSVRGRPGDSGSPLVDGAARIIGLVHGGARCQIATPATRLARLVDRVLGRHTATGETRSAG
jgi:S1-C subfamily serine protease